MWRSFFIGAWLLTVPVVAAAETRSDVNRSKNFFQYRTFTVVVNQPVDKDGKVDETNTIAMDRLRRAVTHELQARGLEPVDVGADLTVRVSSRETEQTVVTATSWGYPFGYSGYWHTSPAFWNTGYLGWGGDIYTHTYLDGTVKVDVIETDTGDLVYRGERVDDVDKDLDKEANKTVRKVFKDYPVKVLYSD